MNSGGHTVTKIETVFQPLKDFHESFIQLHDLLFAFRFSASICITPYVKQKLLSFGATSLENTEEINFKPISEYEEVHVKDAISILRNQSSKQFPYLFEQASINIYTYLEAAIKSLVISIFKVSKNLHDIKQVSSIKISFIEFKMLSEVEQFELLYDQYEKQIGAGLKYGINRFESLLEPIGLSGSRTDLIDNGIFELAQVRNCLLHRNGIVDKKLHTSCPAFIPHSGKRLILTSEMFDKYNHAVQDYISILLNRIGQLDYTNI